tara:strand:- start:615 stop:848 length:234 start_codon:yes stop_codon:yes gene_type:complete
MAQSGRKTIRIDAPLMRIQNKAIWMDQGEWARDFFHWCNKNKFKITAYTHLHGKIKLSFLTAKECTMFGLKYASRKK